MASILEIGDGWRALIRRKGRPSYCKTFTTKEAWACQIEVDIDRGKPPTPTVVLGRRLLMRLPGSTTRLQNRYAAPNEYTTGRKSMVDCKTVVPEATSLLLTFSALTLAKSPHLGVSA